MEAESTTHVSPVRTLARGDENAAEAVRDQILARLRERIVAFAAFKYARENAEDLAQEVLVVIHEKYGHVARMEDLVPLALQILRFKLAAHWRKQSRRGEQAQVSVEDYPLPTNSPDPETILDRKEMLARLSRGITQMGERCRELFRLKLQGHSFPEIRQRMGAETLNTVYTWDHRCRKQLLEWMGGRWER